MDDLDARAQARVGTVLKGKYRIDKVLGVGGMAVVYRATHRNQAEFAVKMLHPELAIHQEISRRFLREGYAANSVKHPGAVLVVDDDVAEDGAAFLVMELLAGKPVDALWEDCQFRMPVDAAVAIVYQLLDILAAAHAKEIVHRDIKPANLFATRDGTIKVLDFGIARARDAALASHATSTGSLLGTPAFMAPEQALGQSKDIGPQTDVWAAGATFFTLVGGTTVHEGENGQQIMVKAATAAARSLAVVAPHVPRAIVEVIDAALVSDRARRWTTAAAMRTALADAARSALGSAPAKGSIERLFGPPPEALAETYAAPGPSREPARVAPTIDATSYAAPAVSGRGLTEVAPVARVAPFIGGTTAQPVLHESPQHEKISARERPRRGVALLTLGGVLGVAVIASAAFFGMRASRPPPEASALGSTPSASAAPADTAPATVAQVAVAAPSVTTVTTTPGAPAAGAAPSRLTPLAPAHAPPPTMTTTTRSTPGSLPATAVAPSAAAPIAQAPPPSVVPPPPAAATLAAPDPTPPALAPVSATPEVVIDRTTGLTWQRRHPVTQVTRDAAANYCRSLGLAGGGWRLPSARELSGAVSGGASAFFPPEGSQVFFWSSTRADDGVQATAVGSDGSTKDDFPAFEGSVRCVRSGAQ